MSGLVAGGAAMISDGTKPEGRDEKFDIIVLATGFGAETTVPGYRKESYWRNEQLAKA